VTRATNLAVTTATSVNGSTSSAASATPMAIALKKVRHRVMARAIPSSAPARRGQSIGAWFTATATLTTDSPIAMITTKP
jgi:hypothetical protein